MKAKTLGIKTEIDEKGEVHAADYDPIQENKLRIKSEETHMIHDVCRFKGIQNMIISPKSVTIEQLMGKFDETSREWTDGLLSHGIRQAGMETTGKDMLITLDGPVEPDWVENINSVLDDNKRLNLVTGEVINLTEKVRIVLETSELNNCSPATISRCAVIYFTKESLQLKTLWNTWLTTLPDILSDQRRRLDSYFNFFMKQILKDWIDPHQLIYPVTPHWAVASFVKI